MDLAKIRVHLFVRAAIGICLFLAPQAKAAFIGNYSLNQFTLVNTNADGSAMSPDAGLSIVITGGNNGSGDPGTTDLTVTALASGLVQFQYSYSALDFPGLDFAGYLSGGNFVQLADTDGQSGSAMFNVIAGSTFGFRVATLDNQGEPAFFTISNFTAPTGNAAVPEPGTSSMLLLAAVGIFTAHRRLIRTSRVNKAKA